MKRKRGLGETKNKQNIRRWLSVVQKKEPEGGLKESRVVASSIFVVF